MLLHRTDSPFYKWLKSLPEDWGTHVLAPIYGVINKLLGSLAIYGTCHVCDRGENFLSLKGFFTKNGMFFELFPDVSHKTPSSLYQ